MKNIVASISAPAVAPRAPRRGPARRMRALLIGTGAIAREHLAALETLPNVDVGAVCDLSAARAESTAERFGIVRWFTDHALMLREVHADLVHITTPPASHVELTRDCLAAGRHVLCEKPITPSYAEWRGLAAFAASRRLHLLENQNCRFNAPVLRMREAIERGALGELRDVQLRIQLDVASPQSRFGDPHAPNSCASLRGGAIADFLPHLSYLACALAGPPSTRTVHTVWRQAAPESPLGFEELRAVYDGARCPASLSFSARAQPSGFWVRVAGTQGEAEANLFEPPRLVVRRKPEGVAAVGTLLDGLQESHDVLLGTVAGFWRKLGGVSPYDGLAELVARTYEALESGAPLPVSIADIDDAARLQEALQSDPAVALSGRPHHAGASRARGCSPTVPGAAELGGAR